MAKKLNKKVAIISIVLVILVMGGIMGAMFGKQIARRLGIGQNPDKALASARQLLEAGDYENAEKEFGRAFAFGKTDAYKIERLFDMAEFHLIDNDQHQADWRKARGCWDKIVQIDPDNIEAREKTLDFFYQVAEAGDDRVWKNVNEQTTELLEALERQQIQPDAELLIKHAQSLLSMAQRGETTDRGQLLTQSKDLVDELIETHPENQELYLLRAQCDLLQGQMDQLAGIRNAEEKSRQNAFQWLETGIDKADDKAAATANLLMFKLQRVAAEPNEIDNLRNEIAARTESLPLNAELLMVKSIAYENTGNSPLEAELNQAIEAMRQARQLDPENMEYTIRMFRLLYRKGMALNDPDAVADAIDLAEEALTMPGTQDTAGPQQGRNRQYRLFVHSFLAEVYLDKAYQAEGQNDTDAAAEWTQKAKPHIDSLKNEIGTAENPMVQKFEGMLALAEGRQTQAIRLMYKAYEQAKALDQQGQPSDIDPVLCTTLAGLMRQKGQLGMEREFLEKAVFNRKRQLLQKPEILLDYAQVLANLRGWKGVLTMVNAYQNRYGTTLRSRTLQAQALIAQNQFDEAEEVLSAMPADEPVTRQLSINLQTAKINQILRGDQKPGEEMLDPTAEQKEQIEKLRTQRSRLLQQWLDEDIRTVDAQTLIGACQDLIRSDEIQAAGKLMDQYLAEHPDNVPVSILRLRAGEDNPLNTSSEELYTIQEKVFSALEDPVKRHVALSQLYRNQGRFEQARATLEEIPQDLAKDNPAVLQAQFETAVQEENIPQAESLLRTIRAQNIDGCEGNLFAAEVQFMKGDYQLALRRLDEALAIQPLAGQIYYLKGRVYEKLEDYEAAIESFQAAQQMDPLNGTYVRSKASVIYARNVKLGSKTTPQQQAEAQQAITQAMILNPNDWRLQSVYAEAISEDNPDQALSLRQLLLKNYPTVENALMLGNMAARLAKSEWDSAKRSGLMDLAGKAYQQAIQIDPENETAMQVYADYLHQTGQGQDVTEVLKDDDNLLWKYYIRNSQFEKAQDILKTLIEKNPDDTDVMRGLVLAAEGMGDRQQVKQYLDRLMELDDSKESELWLFQKYLDNGFTAQVEKRLDSFKERYPQETIPLLIEAWVKMRNGNLEESLSLTNRYLETETENPSAWRLRGRLYRLMNQPQKAISDLQRSKRIKADPMVRLELASVFKETGNMPGAIGELKDGLNDPQTPSQLWFTLESIYQDMDDQAELDNFYTSILEKFPNNIFWLYRIGSYYQQQGSVTKAYRYLKQAWDLSLQQENQELSVLMAYMQSLYDMEKYDEAFTMAAEYIDTPAAPGAYTYMAQVQFKQNQPDKAVESFRKALDKAGTNDRLQTLILESMLKTVGRQTVEDWIAEKLPQDTAYLPAQLLAYRLALQEERFNKAAEHIDQCIEILGQDQPAWLSLAIKKGNALIMAYTKTADKDYLNRSILLFEAMVQEQPNNPSLLNNLAYLLLDNDQQIETAIDYARKAHQSDTDNPVYLDTYAFALCKVGRYREAEHNLLRALQLNEVAGIPIPWDMYHHLAMAYQGQGNARQALENYQKALEAADDVPQEDKQQLTEQIEILKQAI